MLEIIGDAMPPTQTARLWTHRDDAALCAAASRPSGSEHCSARTRHGGVAVAGVALQPLAVTYVVSRRAASPEKDWDRLRTAYARNGIVLVLGAGVSFGSGLPTWETLLERVAAGLNGGGSGEFFHDLRNAGIPLPVVASILEERSHNRLEFVDRVRTALYKDFPFYPEGVTKTNRRQLIRHVQTTNTTLRAVASLCAKRPVGDRVFRPNRRIRAVVTFNLDAVLQGYAYARYEKRLLRTIERASAQHMPGDRINIYHIHGFLRFDARAGDLTKEAPDAMVLTEQNYFEFFNDPTSLFTYTFLYLLRESPCLFIGLSMRDDNVRRLLHYSKAERIQGLVNEGVTPKLARREATRHFAILKRSRTPQLDQAVEESLRPLGVRVLWIEGHADIAERLRDTYEVDGDPWENVF